MEFPSVWALATVLGPIVLIIVFAYAILRRRRLSTAERVAQKQGTERAYREPEEMH